MGTADGKAAPFKRNDRMLEIVPAGVIVFPGSGITGNLADKAKKLGIPVLDHRSSSARPLLFSHGLVLRAGQRPCPKTVYALMSTARFKTRRDEAALLKEPRR